MLQWNVLKQKATKVCPIKYHIPSYIMITVSHAMHKLIYFTVSFLIVKIVLNLANGFKEWKLMLFSNELKHSTHYLKKFQSKKNFLQMKFNIFYDILQVTTCLACQLAIQTACHTNMNCGSMATLLLIN